MRIIVEGKIRGKQRPRHTRSGHVYTPQQTIEYEQHVRNCYEDQGGSYFECPVKLRCYAYMKVPESYTKDQKQKIKEGKVLPIKKVDFDNLEKIIADSLNGIAYPDDSYITNSGCIKRWTFDEERVEFEISEDKPQELPKGYIELHEVESLNKILVNIDSISFMRPTAKKTTTYNGGTSKQMDIKINNCTALLFNSVTVYVNESWNDVLQMIKEQKNA